VKNIVIRIRENKASQETREKGNWNRGFRKGIGRLRELILSLSRRKSRFSEGREKTKALGATDKKRKKGINSLGRQSCKGKQSIRQEELLLKAKEGKKKSIKLQFLL